MNSKTLCMWVHSPKHHLSCAVRRLSGRKKTALHCPVMKLYEWHSSQKLTYSLVTALDFLCAKIRMRHMAMCLALASNRLNLGPNRETISEIRNWKKKINFDESLAEWKVERGTKSQECPSLTSWGWIDLQVCKSHTFVSNFILTTVLVYHKNEYGEPILKKRAMSQKRI